MGCPLSVAQEKKDVFFFLVTEGPSSASQMLHFQHGKKLLGACGADGVLICMYNLKEREKTLCGETFTWKELVCFALISVVWLTLSGDKPNALLLYLWGQAAEVISILQRGGERARQGYYPSLKVPLEWQLGFKRGSRGAPAAPPVAGGSWYIYFDSAKLGMGVSTSGFM